MPVCELPLSKETVRFPVQHFAGESGGGTVRKTIKERIDNK